MKPSNKSPQVENDLTNIFGFDRRDSIQQNVCLPAPIGCGKPATEFKDTISEKEFTISGFCQTCQDKVFG